MSMAESKVTDIVRSLGTLEDDMDSLDAKTAEMKKQLVAKTQAEAGSLLAKTREMASKEAESIIEAARTKATAESKEVEKRGEVRLSEIASKIDASFDQAVTHVVSTVLKP